MGKGTAARQRRLVLLAKIDLKAGKMFGSEEGKMLGSGLCYDSEVEQGLLCVRPESSY